MDLPFINLNCKCDGKHHTNKQIQESQVSHQEFRLDFICMCLYLFLVATLNIFSFALMNLVSVQRVQELCKTELSLGTLDQLFINLGIRSHLHFWCHSTIF